MMESEIMLRVKEEPISDDENEEIDAIGQTNCSEDSTEELPEMEIENYMIDLNVIKTEDIRFNEEQEEESTIFIPQIKLEAADCCREEENHTIEDNVKMEENVVTWTEDHYESSCSSEQPDFRDETCSIPVFKHFLEESEIKYEVQNSLKRKIDETLEDSFFNEERASDEDDVIDVVADEASKPKSKRIKPHKEVIGKSVEVKLKRICRNDITESYLKANNINKNSGLKIRSELCKYKKDAAAKEVLLPPGWRKNEVLRKTGNSVGQKDTYYFSPNGKRFRSLKEVKKYCLENEYHDLDLFSYQINSHKTCESMKLLKPSKPSKKKNKKDGSTISSHQALRQAYIKKNQEKLNKKLAENFEDMADGPNLPMTTGKQKNITTRWSYDVKSFLVTRYLETGSYKVTIADFISKFHITATPPSKLAIEKWCGNVNDTTLSKNFNLRMVEENIKDADDWNLAKSSLRNIRIDKPHKYKNNERIITNVPPKSDNLLTIMKNVFNDKYKDDDDDNVDNREDSLQQDSNIGEAIAKYLKMWKAIYPWVDEQEQTDLHKKNNGNIRKTMDILRKLNEKRRKKKLEAIVIKNTIRKPKPYENDNQDCEESANSDSSPFGEVNLLGNCSTSPKKVVNSLLEDPVKIEIVEERNIDGSLHTDVDSLWHKSPMMSALNTEQNNGASEIGDNITMWKGLLDNVKIEKFVDTWNTIFPELTKKEIRDIYKECKGNGQAIQKMKQLNKERKFYNQCRNGYLRESSLKDESLNNKSDEANESPLQNGKIKKYLKMWKVLYPSVNVQDQRKVYQENKGDVKKTMVELKKLNEKKETERMVKDPYTVWSLADEATFHAGVCCPFCGRFFNYKASFLKHYNTHREEKPFACQFCQYRSKSEENVKIHSQRTHPEDQAFVSQRKKEDRPYACPYCTYRFKFEDTMDRHILATHEKPSYFSKDPKHSYFYKGPEERPFACPHCPYRSKQKGNLKTHMLGKHKNNDYYPI